MTTTDAQPGKTLEERRTTLGLSLNEVADKIRIRREYLAALEENDYAKLPGSTYITGFLRNYAEFLGLNGNQLVTDYLAMRPTTPATDEPQRPIQKQLPRRGIHLGVVAMTGLLLAVYWMSTSQPQPSPQTLTTAAAPASSMLSKEQAVSVPPRSSEPPPLTTEAKPPGPLLISFDRRAVLQLSANGPARVTLTIDGRPEQQYAVTQGALLRWRISDKAELHITDNSQVKLQLNQDQLTLSDNKDIVFTRTTH